MAVYSFYYGASVDRGICIQAQSKELEALPIRPLLKELAALHALDSADHSGEMLSYLLTSGGSCVLGASYIESPKSSGYNRSAPCGLMYVISEAELSSMADRLGKIINFVNFQKPHSPAPAPLEAFPLNESGYSFHNGTAIMAPLTDALARIAMSNAGEVLLIGLPRSKSSSYATARYTIADALSHLPASLRSRIHFFTGLPVAEGETDPLKGFDNAVGFGANVIFCPNEFLTRLSTHRNCIVLDMEKPSGQANAFARYVVDAPDAAVALSALSSFLGGADSYEDLNDAVQKAQSGDRLTVDTLQKELSRANAEVRKLRKTLDDFDSANKQWQTNFNVLQTQKQQADAECKRLQAELTRLAAAQPAPPRPARAPQPNQQRQANVPNRRLQVPPAQTQPVLSARKQQQLQQQQQRTPEPEKKEKSSKLRWILLIVIALLLVAATVVTTVFVTNMLWKDDDGAPASAQTQTADPSDSPAIIPTDTGTDLSGLEPYAPATPPANGTDTAPTPGDTSEYTPVESPDPNQNTNDNDANG